MDFSAWVPAGARNHILRTLEGDGNHWRGIDAFIAEYRADSSIDLTSLEREQACLHRFATDIRMLQVYRDLQTVFTEDEQYAVFLGCAFTAHMDFQTFRERIKQAGNLKPKIAAAARELACLLDKLGDTNTAPPGELYSVRALLDATDNHEKDDYHLRMWRGLRGTITGTQGSEYSGYSRNTLAKMWRESEVRKIEQAGGAKTGEERRSVLLYAWEQAPDLPAVLETVARTAENWTPQEEGAIGAAIASRKANPVTEYIRAFAELLRREMPGTPLAGAVLAAMAGVANVVLNDSSIDVSTDAVRMALARSANGSS